MNKEKEIVDFVFNELFAVDGPLALKHNIHLKSYYKYCIHRYIRGLCKEELGIDFTDEECKIKTQDEYIEMLSKLIKENG